MQLEISSEVRIWGILRNWDIGCCHGPGPMQQGFLDSGRHLLWPQRRVRRCGLRSAARPASGLALNAVVSLGSFAPLVLCSRAVWGRRFGESKERADMITARANG